MNALRPFLIECCVYPCSVCVVLVVHSQAQYNDSITSALRGVARAGLSVARTSVDFAYIDASRQRELVAALSPPPASPVPCNGEEESARPVSHSVSPPLLSISSLTCIPLYLTSPLPPPSQVLMLRRATTQHAQLAWLPSFCSTDDDLLLLRQHITASWSRKLVGLKELVDEEAPVGGCGQGCGH